MNNRLILTITIILLFYQTVTGQPKWDIISPFPTHGNITGLDFIDDDNGYLITDGGRLMQTTDGGTNWSEMSLATISIGPWQVDFLSEDVGWVLGGTLIEEPWFQVIYHTDDGGESWGTWLLGGEEATCELTSIQIESVDRGWAVGSVSTVDGTGAVVYSFDSNQGWAFSRLPDSEYITLRSVSFLNRNIGWVVGDQGYIGRTANSGQQWEKLDSGTEANLYDVDFYSLTHGWTVGGNFNEGLILGSTNGGESWNQQDDHPDIGRIVALSAISRDEAVAIIEKNNASSSRVISTVDDNEWSIVYESQTEALLSLSSTSNRAWIGGKDGYIARASHGHEWSEQTFRINRGIGYDIQFLDENIGWCASDTSLLYTANAGTDWVEIGVEHNQPLFTVHFIDENHGWIGGFPSREYYTDDGGDSWQLVQISDDDVRSIRFNDDHGYAISRWHVSSTSDGGEHWNSNRVFPNDYNPMNLNLSVPTPEIAFAASAADSLMMTSNGGEDWRNANMPAQGCYGVSFPDEQYGWAVGVRPDGSGRLFSTTNGGDSWRQGVRFDFEVMGVNFIDRESGWIWGRNGEIYGSEDAGRSWTDLMLKASTAIRGFHAASQDRFWICGEGSLLARWGENWQSVDDPINPEPSMFLLDAAYPNPTNSRTRVNYRGDLPIETQFKMYDVFGRRVDGLVSIQSDRLRNSFEIDLMNLPSGSYYFSIDTGSRISGTMIILLK